MDVTKYLYSRGFGYFEGHCQQVPKQVEDLINFVNKGKVNMMEIGFNAGHSAETFLGCNKDLTLTSFDLGDHEYVSTAKEYIDIVYPKRHTLILGDSTISIPKFIKENKDIKYDVIFIDGGHNYKIARADMENCMHLANKDTLVILDDTIFTENWEQEWTMGPTKVWKEFLEEKKIKELGKKDYQIGRGMCWGNYIL